MAYRLSNLGFLVFVASFLFAVGLAAADPLQQAKFSMSSTARVTAEPDRAVASAGVISEAEDAEAAMQENAQRMQAAFETLEKAGVERRHIQTSNFNLEPRYFYHDRNDRGQQKPPELVGYRVTNMVRVKIVELDDLGRILSALVESGVNRLDGVRFHVSNRKELLDEARVKAVKGAQRKAELYAEAAGVQLGRVLNIQENRRTGAPRLQTARLAIAESTPIAPGEASLSVTVTMTWELEE